ncbi:MAG: DUF11 domain-containing protein, partial [Gammaproteobacteria bacterium]|nr:DUF11 domain-containing protein [Gammaproteobacteria bacterium]
MQLLILATAQADISGTVFRDINLNGINDTEPGLVGIDINAYDSSGALVGNSPQVSAPDGTYTLTGIVGTVRIEFSLPQNGTLDGLRPSTSSAGDTTVQFAVDGSTDINIGYHVPAQFCEDNPTLVTSCFVAGSPDGGNVAPNSGSYDALVGFPYNATGNEDGLNPPDHLAYVSEIGSIWGLAYSHKSEAVYSSQFIKRHSGTGVNGAGAIYQTYWDTGLGQYVTVELVDAVDDLGIMPAFATDTDRGLANTPGFSLDLQAYLAVGKQGLGDLDLSEDHTSLWTITLHNQTLHSIVIDSDDDPNTRPDPTTDVTSTPIPDPGCVGGSWRPFALKVYAGSVYVGGVCDAQTSADVANLRGVVYQFDGSTFANVLDIPLDYAKGLPVNNSCADDPPSDPSDVGWNAQWFPWTDDTPLCPATLPRYSYPVPMFSDIEFDADGSMVVGFMDRTGHQYQRGNFDQHGNWMLDVVVGGDILRACGDPYSGWTLENNGSCGGVSTAGEDNLEGPGGGEYYLGDRLFQLHREIGNGGLALNVGSGEVAMGAMDPVTGIFLYTGGVAWLSNTTGQKTRGYQLYDSPADGNATFGKGNGIGDIELLCSAAPIEIGNFVWMDSNADGVQDPDELPIVGVAVELWADSTGDGNVDMLVGTTATDASGQYVFGGTSNANMNQSVPGFDALPSNTAVEVRIPLNDVNLPSATTTAIGGAVDSSASNDMHDNDGDSGVINAGYSTIEYTTGLAGDFNHTLDFGFLPSPGSIGSTVFYDLNNNGMQDSGELGIPGVTVELFLGNVSVGTTMTNATGDYYFDGLKSGDYIVSIPTPPVDAPRSSTDIATSTADNQVDGDDNGQQVNTGDATQSPVITLTIDNEPEGEAGQGGNQDAAADDSGDMTIDFGFVVPSYDLALIKEIAALSSTPVVNGTQVTYELSVMNQGVFRSGVFSVEDTLPSGMSFVSSTPTATAVAGGLVTFDIALADELAPGEIMTITLIAQVDDVNLAPFRNTTQIASDSSAPYGGDDDSIAGDGSDTTDTFDDTDVTNDNDPGDADDSDFNVLPVSGGYDLALVIDTLSISPLPAVLGSEVTYQVTVMNQGGVPSGAFDVETLLAPGITFVSATGPVSSDPGVGSNGVVEWTIPVSSELLPGQSMTLQVVGTIDDDSLLTYRTEADITADSGAPHGDDEDSVPGDGSGAADTFDDPDVTNDNDPNDADDSDFELLSLTPEYDLALIIETAGMSTPDAQTGTDVTYTITVKNQGNVASGAFSVEGIIPAGMGLVSTSLPTVSSPGLGSAGTLGWDIGLVDELLPGETLTIQFVASILDDSLSPFKVISDITADSGAPYGGDDDSTPGDNSGALDTFNDSDECNDQDPGDQDDSDFELLSTDAYDLSLVKDLTGSSATPIALGSQLTFVITVMNQSGSVSGAYSVQDSLPAQLGYVSATPAPSSHPGVGNTGNVQWDVTASAELQPGAQQTFTVVAEVIADQGGDWRNVAQIISDSGDDEDSDPADNSGTTDTIDDLDVTTDVDLNDEDDSDFADFTIQPRYDLSLVKRLDANQPAWIVTGQAVEFDVSIQNQGNVPSGDFTVVDTLPAGMSYISASGPNVSCIVDTPAVGQVECMYAAPSAGALAPGAEVLIDVTLQADDLSLAPFKNWAEITADSAQSLYGVDDDDSITGSNVGAGDTGSGEGTDGADTTVDENDHDDINSSATDEDDSDPAVVRAAASTPISLTQFSSVRQSDGSVVVRWSTS